MYQITIENGLIDNGGIEEIRDSGYLTDDITNGCYTILQGIRTIKQVNHFIDIVKDDAISLHVFKLVEMPVNIKVKAQIKQNCKNLFPKLH